MWVTNAAHIIFMCLPCMYLLSTQSAICWWYTLHPTLQLRDLLSHIQASPTPRLRNPQAWINATLCTCCNMYKLSTFVPYNVLWWHFHRCTLRKCHKCTLLVWANDSTCRISSSHTWPATDLLLYRTYRQMPMTLKFMCFGVTSSCTWPTKNHLFCGVPKKNSLWHYNLVSRLHAFELQGICFLVGGNKLQRKLKLREVSCKIVSFAPSWAWVLPEAMFV